jgi:iron complex transport system ATP-binding protein
MKLEIKNLSCGYEKKIIIKNFSVEVNSGEVLSILGSNGIGKTTIFKTILGLLEAFEGEILVDGKNILKLNDKAKAKLISYVPQAHTPPFSFTVLDVVVMGRDPYLGAFGTPNKKDFTIAKQALEDLNISFLENRIYTDLSGGERQMVLIARALCQKTPILILDEPTSNLDYGNEVQVLKQIKKLANKGYIVIMTSHSPEQAFQCEAKVMLIQKNQKFLYGKAKEIITNKNLKNAYNVEVEVTPVTLKNRENTHTCIPII